jgi:hypothetical protein
MGEIRFTETSADIQRTTLRYIPQDTALHLVRLLELGIGLSQALCLHRTSQTEKNPCAKWNSNPRLQCSIVTLISTGSPRNGCNSCYREGLASRLHYKRSEAFTVVCNVCILDVTMLRMSGNSAARPATHLEHARRSVCLPGLTAPSSTLSPHTALPQFRTN